MSATRKRKAPEGEPTLDNEAKSATDSSGSSGNARRKQAVLARLRGQGFVPFRNLGPQVGQIVKSNNTILVGRACKLKGNKCILIGSNNTIEGTGVYYCDDNCSVANKKCMQIKRTGDAINISSDEVIEILERISDLIESGKGFMHATCEPRVLRTPDRGLETLVQSETASGSCAVCYERMSSCRLHPCSHVCLCVSCAQTIGGKRPSTCPLCSAIITEFQNVFFS